MKKTDRVVDAILNKVKGGNIDTYKVSLEEFLNLLDKYFLSISDFQGLDEIKVVVKGKLFTNVYIDLPDYQFYHLYRARQRHEWYGIVIKKTDTHYVYRPRFRGKLKKAVDARIQEYKSGILSVPEGQLGINNNSTPINNSYVSNNISNTWRCPNCGNSALFSHKFCNKCGTPQPTNSNMNGNDNRLFCTGCGTPLDIDSKFCNKCGKKVN